MFVANALIPMRILWFRLFSPNVYISQNDIELHFPVLLGVFLVFRMIFVLCTLFVFNTSCALNTIRRRKELCFLRCICVWWFFNEKDMAYGECVWLIALGRSRTLQCRAVSIETACTIFLVVDKQQLYYLLALISNINWSFSQQRISKVLRFSFKTLSKRV